MEKRGRPVKSEIRQKIVDILYFMKEGYGYEIYKVYCDIYPKVSQRVIYYHLKKGEALGEFKVSRISKEKGEYSWGGEAEKVYYSLGNKANPSIDKRVKKYFEKSK